MYSHLQVEFLYIVNQAIKILPLLSKLEAEPTFQVKLICALH
jgi:hypothetical protein